MNAMEAIRILESMIAFRAANPLARNADAEREALDMAVAAIESCAKREAESLDGKEGV